ncbi:hypothetical protein [Paenibacillus sp. OV219]|uniref:hypothetical protein n=1 Tax=Paenibacillus sp. OV219 TaxID=1884377 RepID=UPI0008C37142|nr:hypothetical protein [Paenibacillus sp. OV219]SEN80953.1 hypothetical protein SAMN05518847_104195 [Paenibacillus sp. OV219]
MDNLSWIRDKDIRRGVNDAIQKTLTPALSEKLFPGHFMVEADGEHFGQTWVFPGLDAWEISGAYLLMGKIRAVLDYFDFAHASQREDGHIPFAVFPIDKPPVAEGAIKNIRYPEDMFTYAPIQREGQPPHSNMSAQQWIGLFEHWVPNNPLGVLGPISYLLTGEDIMSFTNDVNWLREKIGSLEQAGRYVLSCKCENGLIDGAGFYMEMYSRHKWDGVTQCYAIHAFHRLAGLHQKLGDEETAALWLSNANELQTHFQEFFWQEDHYAEYIHPEHGIVDFHGLTDVNWAAVAFGIADEEQSALVWNVMTREHRFWRGDFPTQVISVAYLFRDWEIAERMPFQSLSMGELHDVAAMGRVWYLEAMACIRMNDTARLVKSVELVCAMGARFGGYWFERYQPLQTWDVFPTGAKRYCEYAAILTRIVLGNQHIFS